MEELTIDSYMLIVFGVQTGYEGINHCRRNHVTCGFFFLWCLLLLFPHEPPGHLTLFLARAHWHASISIQKMNVFFFQKFPGVLKGRIWFLLGFGWEEKVKKKKIQSGKKSKNIFLMA